MPPAALSTIPRELRQKIFFETFNTSINEDLKTDLKNMNCFESSLDGLISTDSPEILTDIKYVISNIRENFGSTISDTGRRVKTFIKDGFSSGKVRIIKKSTNAELESEIELQLVYWDKRYGNSKDELRYLKMILSTIQSFPKKDGSDYGCFHKDFGFISAKYELKIFMAYVEGRRKHEMMEIFLEEADELVDVILRDLTNRALSTQ